MVGVLMGNENVMDIRRVNIQPLHFFTKPVIIVPGINHDGCPVFRIEEDIGKGSIDSRKAYRELSSVIRLFVFDMTGIKVQNYTLTEISILKIKPLTTLVAEYYSPEFEKGEKGDIKNSIQKTRGVIQRWR